MKTNVLLVASLLAAAPSLALGAPAPGPEEPRREAPPAKTTPTPATVKKTPSREAAPSKTQPKKTDPRGLEVEPVDFKKVPEKPKPG